MRTTGSLAVPDMEAALAAAMARIEARFALEMLPVPPELAEPKSFLKILRARHMNWRSPHFRKVFAMRFNVRVPALDQMNLITYPAPAWETPVFLFFCLLTGRKLIGHVNVNLMREDRAYAGKWTAPLLAIRERFPPFDCDDRYPEWMLKWRTPAGIYGMFPRERFADFIGCSLEYLATYVELAAAEAPVADAAILAEVATRQAQFVSDIRTQDKAQGMMARMIGASTARRIFYEVTT